MPAFRYEIIVETDTQEHADMVIRERIDHDEELTCEQNECSCGERFDYTIEQASTGKPA